MINGRVNFFCGALSMHRQAALNAIAHMKQGRVISLDSELAIDAGNYGALHMLPLADSVIFASAQKYNATIWTQDADFKGVPKVKYFPAKNT
jgi:toxin FitB